MGVEGKTKKACLETLTDHYLRFLKIQKVAGLSRKTSLCSRQW